MILLYDWGFQPNPHLNGRSIPMNMGKVLGGGSSMVQIELNMMSHPDDLKAAIALVQLCREIGNSAALGPYTKREVTPVN
jgi:choline dehydrogenase-like flavoprotein